MSEIQHSQMTSSMVHEPKHITNASTADSGMVITPSSATSGISVLRRLSLSDISDGGDVLTEESILDSDILNFQGWQMVEDGEISAPTISVTSTPTLITIDDEDENNNTNSDYIPRAIRPNGTLWNTANSRITPVAVGDTYDLRLNLTLSAASGSPDSVTLLLDIGTGGSPSNVVAERVHTLSKTPPFSVSFSIPVFTLDTFLANGGRFFLKTNTGTVTVSGRSLLIVRTGSGANAEGIE